MSERRTSCGVLVLDGAGRLLLGQATGSKRWDIPKGLAEADESFVTAAVRELQEETSLVATPDALQALGVFRYLPGKDLALFRWEAGQVDPAALRCLSTFRTRDGREIPELARFALLSWPDALERVGKNMARVLGGLSADRPHPRPLPMGEGS